MSGSAVFNVITWKLRLMSKVIVSSPAIVFASCIAARKVQAPVPSLQTPSARLLSAPSPVELTVKKVAALTVGQSIPAGVFPAGQTHQHEQQREGEQRYDEDRAAEDASHELTFQLSTWG